MTDYIMHAFDVTDFQARLIVLAAFFASAIVWGIVKGLRR